MEAQVDDPDDVVVLQQRFASFARHADHDSPLYARLADVVANDPAMAELLLFAAPGQRQPVLWLAAVHDALLRDPTDPLAAHYPNLAGDRVATNPVASDLRRFVTAQHAQLITTLRHRRTQTNEVGRANLFLPVFDRLAAEVGRLHHVDVGTSAGLNLLLPHFRYQYEPGGVVGPESAVTLVCEVRGELRLPHTVPPIATALGIDPDPIDLADPADARWLTACIWPDQVTRFKRLNAAIALARQVGVDVRRGSATSPTDVAQAVAAAGGAHPVLTTSWVLNYLDHAERQAFVDELDQLGSTRDLSAVFVEHPGLCPELPGMPPRNVGGTDVDGPTAVVVVTWRDGRRAAWHAADAHPHGRWIRPLTGVL